MKKISSYDQKYRDWLIIKCGIDESVRKGETPSDFYIKLINSLSWQSSNSELSEYDIDAPCILLEGERQNLHITEFYLDPVVNFKPMPKEIYLPKWHEFMYLLLSTEAKNNIKKQDYAYSLLERAVINCRSNYGMNTARTFVQRLHDNRWSIGIEMSAHLFTLATISHQDELITLVNEKSFIDELIAKNRDELNIIKQKSETLTDWIEGLYSLSPRVYEILNYLKLSKLEDSDKWWRFFSEVDADIIPTLIRSELSVQNQFVQDDEILEWLKFYINERELVNSHSEFKKRLQYLHKSRTTIPKFWMESALKHYESTDESYPKELYEIDPFRVISIMILILSSSRWIEDKMSKI